MSSILHERETNLTTFFLIFSYKMFLSPSNFFDVNFIIRYLFDETIVIVRQLSKLNLFLNILKIS